MIPIQDAWTAVAREYLRHIVPGFLPAARSLCEGAGIGPGDRVLDIACGPGTASCVARGMGAAAVTGIDFAPGMVRLAREEAEKTGAAERTGPIQFLEGNALALPLGNHKFDVVVSNFGVIFAPDAPKAVSEMARVLRPGGRLSLTAWPRRGAIGDYYDIVDRHLPPAPSPHDPHDWGRPERARAWLDPVFADIVGRALQVPFKAASAQEAWHLLRNSTGRVSSGYSVLPAERRGALDQEMHRFFARLSRAGGISWPREATLITGTRR